MGNANVSNVRQDVKLSLALASTASVGDQRDLVSLRFFGNKTTKEGVGELDEVREPGAKKVHFASACGSPKGCFQAAPAKKAWQRTKMKRGKEVSNGY